MTDYEPRTKECWAIVDTKSGASISIKDVAKPGVYYGVARNSSGGAGCKASRHPRLDRVSSSGFASL